MTVISGWGKQEIVLTIFHWCYLHSTQADLCAYTSMHEGNFTGTDKSKCVPSDLSLLLLKITPFRHTTNLIKIFIFKEQENRSSVTIHIRSNHEKNCHKAFIDLVPKSSLITNEWVNAYIIVYPPTVQSILTNQLQPFLILVCLYLLNKMGNSHRDMYPDVHKECVMYTLVPPLNICFNASTPHEWKETLHAHVVMYSWIYRSGDVWFRTETYAWD